MFWCGCSNVSTVEKSPNKPAEEDATKPAEEFAKMHKVSHIISSTETEKNNEITITFSTKTREYTIKTTPDTEIEEIYNKIREMLEIKEVFYLTFSGMLVSRCNTLAYYGIHSDINAEFVISRGR